MAHIEDRARRQGRSGGKRWRVRYLDVSGRERSKSFDRKSDAQQFLTSVTADVLRGTYIDPSAGRMTLSVYADQWFTHQLHLKPNSRLMYESHLRNHIKPTLGEIPLANLQRSDVSTAVKHWSLTLSSATIKTVHAVLSAILNDAVADERIVRNVASRVPLPRVEKRDFTPLTGGQVMAAADAISPRFRVAVLLAAGCGLREGEALGLTRARVNFLRRRIHVEEQLQPLTSGGVGVLCSLKTTASRRVVPADDVILDATAAHIATWPETQMDLLVTNRLGAPVRRGSFGDAWRRAIKKAGLPVGTRFHDLRHFYATALIHEGIHPKALQVRMGHASIVETMDTYGHLFPEAEDAGRGVFDAAFHGPATAQRESRAN